MARAETSASSVTDRLALWNRELLDELLPLQEERNVPVLLACDDETLRAVGDRLGYDAAQRSRQHDVARESVRRSPKASSSGVRRRARLRGA